MGGGGILLILNLQEDDIKIEVRSKNWLLSYAQISMYICNIQYNNCQ